MFKCKYCDFEATGWFTVSKNGRRYRIMENGEAWHDPAQCPSRIPEGYTGFNGSCRHCGLAGLIFLDGPDRVSQRLYSTKRGIRDDAPVPHVCSQYYAAKDRDESLRALKPLKY